jgi:hypothetical protein
MSTVANLYRDIGQEIGDPGNALVPTWKLLTWINKAIHDIVVATNCLWTYNTITGAWRIAILDWDGLDGEENTVTITVDETETELVEATDWDAETSNGLTASNLATALDAVTGVAAYADYDGGYVYVLGIDEYEITALTCDAATTDLTIADTGYETLELPSIFSNLRAVRNIYNVDDEVLYRPITRQQWDRYLLYDDFDGYVYTVTSNKDLWIKRNGENLTSSESIKIEYWTWETALTLATESPPGIIDDFDDIIVNRCVRRHLQNQRFDNPRAVEPTILSLDKEYARFIKDIKRELRSHGEPHIQRFVFEWK